MMSNNDTLKTNTNFYLDLLYNRLFLLFSVVSQFYNKPLLLSEKSLLPSLQVSYRASLIIIIFIHVIIIIIPLVPKSLYLVLDYFCQLVCNYRKSYPNRIYYTKFDTYGKIYIYIIRVVF